MVDGKKVRAGQCHCGAVRFEATLSDGFNSILRCTCSYCRMRGAVVAMAEMGGIRILQGEHTLTSYRFHTGSAQHFHRASASGRRRRGDRVVRYWLKGDMP